MRLTHSNKPQVAPKASPAPKGEALDVSLPRANVARVSVPLPPPTPRTAKEVFEAVNTALEDRRLLPLLAAMEREGITWTSGGCGILAQAIHETLPGSVLWATVEHGEAGHILVCYEGLLIDAEGVWNKDQVLNLHAGMAVQPLDSLPCAIDLWTGPQLGDRHGFDGLLRSVLKEYLNQ